MIQKHLSPLNNNISSEQEKIPAIKKDTSYVPVASSISKKNKKELIEELKNHILHLTEHQMDSAIHILRRWINETS